jgi:hypothetical protein
MKHDDPRQVFRSAACSITGDGNGYIATERSTATFDR